MKGSDTDRQDVTAVVLAGGMSRRLGRNKALEPIGGEPLIRRVVARMGMVARATIVVANNDERVDELNLPSYVVSAVDAYPDKGSLGGILTGLDAVSTQWAAFCACDMPFLNAELYRTLLALREGYDAVVPVIDGRPEPVHAVYSRDCIESIRARIVCDDLKISSFFEHVRVRLVPEDCIRKVDPDLLSFFNINTQDDLDAAIAIAAAEDSR